MLPDDVLLVIFDNCTNKYQNTKKDIEAWWHSLVHVCRRWRAIVFVSPRRLNLRLVCPVVRTHRVRCLLTCLCLYLRR